MKSAILWVILLVTPITKIVCNPKSQQDLNCTTVTEDVYSVTFSTYPVKGSFAYKINLNRIK